MLLSWGWLEKSILRIQGLVVMKLSLNILHETNRPVHGKFRKLRKNYKNMSVICFRVENSFVKRSLSICLEAGIFH